MSLVNRKHLYKQEVVCVFDGQAEPTIREKRETVTVNVYSQAFGGAQRTIVRKKMMTIFQMSTKVMTLLMMMLQDREADGSSL